MQKNQQSASGGITRRSFIKFGGAAALTLALPGALSTLTGCRSEAGDAFFRGERKVVDHAGREVVIPTTDKLERIYFTSGLAEIYVFSLAPELQGGCAYQFTDEELEYLPDDMDKLKYMGSLAGGGEIDLEMLMAEDIQLVFDVSAVAISSSDISTCNNLQDQTGIPVVMVDGSFTNVMNAYRFIGDIMGQTARAEKIAAYCEGIYDDVRAAVGDIPDEQKVSLESVIQWDPEVIIAWDDVIRGGADEIIRTSSDWAVIRAVRNGRVYTMPNAPFAWCDRPPGVNRFLGLQWVANILYPDRYDVDMVEEVKRFYSLLYRCDITDDQAKDLLGNSYPPYGKR